MIETISGAGSNPGETVITRTAKLLLLDRPAACAAAAGGCL
jgi:hypothetical protein